MGNAALIFAGAFFILITIPCVGVAWLGKSLIDKLGTYPSKTPAIQVDMVIKLAFLEVVSFALLLGFFKALVAAS